MKRVFSEILLVAVVTGTLVMPLAAESKIAVHSIPRRTYRLLAIEQMYGDYHTRSAQWLIHDLMRYPN